MTTPATHDPQAVPLTMGLQDAARFVGVSRTEFLRLVGANPAMLGPCNLSAGGQRRWTTSGMERFVALRGAGGMETTG